MTFSATAEADTTTVFHTNDAWQQLGDTWLFTESGNVSVLVEKFGSDSVLGTEGTSDVEEGEPTLCPSIDQYAPDGPDPWGGCWPGPDTVGVPSGTIQEVYVGSCTITVNNTTIDSKILNCPDQVQIEASNVTIRNSTINGGVLLNDDDGVTAYSFTLEDNDIDALVTRAALYGGNRGMGKNNFVAERNNIYGGISSAWCEYDCIARDNYMHGQGVDLWGCQDPDWVPIQGQARQADLWCLHESGIRQGSGNGSTTGVQLIEHNVITCDPEIIDPFPIPSGLIDNTLDPPREIVVANDTSGCSADMTGYGDFNPIRNNTVNRNLFQPTTGGYCAYGGSSNSKPFPVTSNQVFTQNYFLDSDQPGSSGCGYYGTSTDFDDGDPGSTWSGNKFWNGSVLTDLDPNE